MMYRYYRGVYYRWLVYLLSGVSVAIEARLMITVYSRFRDICIYIYIYVGTLTAIRSTTLRSRLFNRYGRRRHFSWRQPGWRQRFKPYTRHKKRPDNDSDLGRTRTATGQKKRSWSQTAAQREEELAAEQLRHIPFFITSSYYCKSPRQSDRESFGPSNQRNHSSPLGYTSWWWTPLNRPLLGSDD